MGHVAQQSIALEVLNHMAVTPIFFSHMVNHKAIANTESDHYQVTQLSLPST